MEDTLVSPTSTYSGGSLKGDFVDPGQDQVGLFTS